ncbi:MAG: DMT family transporter [Alphaproteobacteria bacterium]|nr:DMT family transporter [Alphaproteobacteria bacterium]
MTHQRAIFCSFIAYFALVLYDTTVKLARQASVSAFAIMLVVGMMGMIGVMGLALVKRDARILRPSSFRGIAIICLCSVAIRYCNITALNYLSLTLFYAIQFTAPLVIALLSVLLKHETLTRLKTGCLFAGFFGILVILAPRLSSATGEAIGYLTAFSSVFLFAISTVTMHEISQRESVESVQFFNFLSLSLFGLGGAVLGEPNELHANALMILLAGGVAFTLGNLLFNQAIKFTVSTNVAQMHYTQIIIGGIIGYLIWDDVPTWQLAVGSIIIITAGVLVAFQAQKATILEKIARKKSNRNYFSFFE